MSHLLNKAQRLCRQIESLDPSGEALVVGGAVRDVLLGRECSDVDIAHNLSLPLIKEAFGADGVGRGEEFGVTVVTFEDERFEVTCYRQESGYSDGKRPDTVTTTKDFKLDSARRDFTINSMGMHHDGKIEDPWGGQSDIKNRIVRCVGCSMDRFAEDPVRMLRAARFAAVLDFDLDGEAVAAARGFAIRLNDVAPDRITKEILKASQSGKSLAKFINHCDRMNLLPGFLPEVVALKGLPHAPEHHPEGGVFEHTMAALNVSDSQIPEHNLAILLHDIGKAKTHETSPQGKPTYRGHEAVGAEMIPAIAERLHWPKHLTTLCEDVCREHMKGHILAEMSKPTRVALRLSENWPAIKDAILADSRCRMHLHDEQFVMEQMGKLDVEATKWGDQKELNKKLNSLASGHTIMQAIPGIAGQDIGKVKTATWDWLVGRSLNANPQEVDAFIKDTYGGLPR